MTVTPPLKNQTGFTLIEVIVTLTVGAILGTMLVTYMGRTLADSVTPVLRVQNANALGQVVENITANYFKLNYDDLKNDTNVALKTLSDNIDDWNDPSNTPYYGPYVIVFKGYIAFENGVEVNDTSSDKRVLKVTLKQGDQKITTLFAKLR